MSNSPVRWSLAGVMVKVLLPLTLLLAGEGLALQLDEREIIQSGSPDVLGAAIATLVVLIRISAGSWLLVNVLVLRKKPHDTVPDWMKRSV